MNKPVFYVVSSMPFSKDVTDRPVISECAIEDDAEEVGAAMALAGFHAKVYVQAIGGDKLMHEFFPQTDGYGHTTHEFGGPVDADGFTKFPDSPVRGLCIQDGKVL